LLGQRVPSVRTLRALAQLEEAVGPVMSVEVPEQEESLVLIAMPGQPHERPGQRDLQRQARAAWEAAGLGGAAARLVRRMHWVEVRAAAGRESGASDDDDGFVELVPPDSTVDGVPTARPWSSQLRTSSSACEWMAGAGPPHGFDEEEEEDDDDDDYA
jgi:hypothetical protein